MTHSDDKGLVLPPKIAPVQVVIIPIKTNDETVLSAVKSVAKQLVGISFEIDSRENLRPGEKYYEWEKKGIPIRMEIGPKDLEKNTVVLVRRDTGVKESCLINHIQKRVEEILYDIQSNLFAIALKRREENNKIVDSWQEFEKAIKRGGYVFSYFCGDKSCEAEIKVKTKAVSRFLPINTKEEEGDYYCIHCSKKTTYKKRWAFALSY